MRANTSEAILARVGGPIAVGIALAERRLPTPHESTCKEESMTTRIGSSALTAARHLAAAMVLTCLAASLASAQDRIGGHFGAVFPLVTHANGETTNIGDNFSI